MTRRSVADKIREMAASGEQASASPQERTFSTWCWGFLRAVNNALGREDENRKIGDADIQLMRAELTKFLQGKTPGTPLEGEIVEELQTRFAEIQALKTKFDELFAEIAADLAPVASPKSPEEDVAAAPEAEKST